MIPDVISQQLWQRVPILTELLPADSEVSAPEAAFFFLETFV